jgi:sialate O-acetylesterase
MKAHKIPYKIYIKLTKQQISVSLGINFQMKLITFLIVLIIQYSIALAHANSISQNKLQLSSIFQHHMILQRDQPISVWGKAQAGSEIKVIFAAQKATTTTNEHGHWTLQLPALKASFSPQSMTVSTSTNQKITLDDILIGEVWICAGQSNMQLTVNKVKEIEALKATAKHIRSFAVKRTVSFNEQNSMGGSWQPTIPDSAVAFSFAYYLQQRANVPVGIILTAWGSSSLEAWMPRDLTAKLPYFNTIMQEFDNDSKRKEKINSILSGPQPWTRKDDVYLRRQPNILFNAMMKPIAPFTVRGLVWYQGERNTQSMHGLVAEPWYKMNSGMLKYRAALQTWIKRYRKEWHNDKMNFMIVMLPRYKQLLSSSPTKDIEQPNAHSWAWMRESQIAAEQLQHVTVVNTIDLGDPTNIHPRDKLPIGQRLAQLAARDTLEHKIAAKGPVFKKAVTSANSITLHFDHNEGLTTTNGKAPTEFWLATDKQQWVNAEAKIVNNTIVLRHEKITHPLYVRYAFTGAPNVNLVNHTGLPAQPFRTDSFPP